MGHPICSITTTTSGKNIVSGNGSRSWTRRPASLPYGTPSTQKKSSAGASSNPNDKSSILQHTSIEALQGRGVKFLSCHTATEEQVHAMAKEYFLKEPFENVVKDIQSHALPGVLIVPAMGRRLAAAVRWPLHLHHSVETKSVQMGTRVTLIPTALIISSCFLHNHLHLGAKAQIILRWKRVRSFKSLTLTMCRTYMAIQQSAAGQQQLSPEHASPRNPWPVMRS